MHAFPQHVEQTATNAASVFEDIAARLRLHGLDADAALADRLASRMRLLAALPQGSGTYFDSVATYAGLTARAAAHLTSAIPAQISVERVEEASKTLGQLARDCLTETQPIGPPRTL